MDIKHFFSKLVNPQFIDLPQAGIYHYLREEEDMRSRLHLRLDEDKHGTLIINANQILHLNPSAAFMAYLTLENIPEPQALQSLSRHYRARKEQLRTDYHTIQGQINELVKPNGACPVHELGLETTAPFSARPSAPYRMDLAITYRCNNDCAHCYNVEGRHVDELSTQEWKDVLNRLWELGIPHIIFTGGEPTLRNDLPELIAHAEGLGQITGLNTNGRRLSDPVYLNQLVQAGLDHVQITLESHDENIHDQMVGSRGAWQQTVNGLRGALDSTLYVMTNTTMLSDNVMQLADTLDFLAKLGIKTVGLNALIYSGRGQTVGKGLDENQLPELLAMAQQRTQEAGQKLIWYTPTEYCRFDPILLDLGVKGCTAALYNMCIEPNGDTIPCQSTYQSVGNILQSSWQEIWEHDLCVRLRERHYVGEKCRSCALLVECGGGCPLKEQYI